MKNYVIAFLAICVVVALSFMYKNVNHNIKRSYLEGNPQN